MICDHGGNRVGFQTVFPTSVWKGPAHDHTLRQRMHEDLQLAGLAEGTQTAYLRAVRQLAAHFHKPPDQLTEQEVREYLLYLKNERNYSSRFVEDRRQWHHVLLHPHRPAQLGDAQEAPHPHGPRPFPTS